MSGSSRGRAGGRDSAVKAGHVLAGEAGRNRPVSFSRGTGGAHSPQKARTRGGRLGLTGNGRLRLALASKSPARLATLQAAGFDPLVQVSDVDEEALLESVRGGPAQKVLALATAKARAVAYDAREAAGAHIVVGCDSMFEFDGEAVGKPGNPEKARDRIARMAGRSGLLHTGHQIVHLESGASLGAVSHAVVHFAPMSDAEVEAYVATGEPLHVAGAFTVDGLGGPFVERVDGDYHGVVGISLPLLRAMLANWGVSITRLWQPPVKLAGDAAHSPAVESVLAAADGTPSDNSIDSGAAGVADASGAAGLLAAGSGRPKPGSKPHSGRRRKGADGFILCPCGSEHWGLAGAAGILAFRERESIEVLVQLRAEWSHSGGTWSNPGGAIGWSETPLEGALREFEEETAIGADSLDVVGSIVRDHGDWRYTTFAARCETAEPVPNDESLALEWAPLDDLLEGRLDRPVHPAFAEDLPRLAEVIRGAAS
ncbi:Maf family nucleotide pyrophosphatase [Peptidiphaga gingivicola]|uniref:Maf family nucleotide pyrophosphatase n=1 Tax=Peptidiphaga gingivicola TaxID=2741497 RepID=UPI000AF051D2|nr:Maf family nucleotide pyrophosphatase [Peptidiphaga gingivicola]